MRTGLKVAEGLNRIGEFGERASKEQADRIYGAGFTRIGVDMEGSDRM